MRRASLLLGEIIQREVKAYLPRDVEEERIFYKVLGDIAIIDTSNFYSQSRRSIYELNLTRRRSNLYEYHRLRVSIYR